MQDTARRAWLYGIATSVLAGLVYGGFVHKGKADIGTMLGTVDVQLRLAYGIPATDKHGKELGERKRMIDEAEKSLDQVEALQPAEAMVTEFRGFICNLRGDYRGAAALYQKARTLPGCDAEMSDTLVFNQARMLMAAGDTKGALAIFAEHADKLQPKYRSERLFEEAEIFRRLGDTDAACARLMLVVDGQVDSPMVWVDAAQQLEALGRFDSAEVALDKAAATAPIADYYRSRLKLHRHDVDSCMELLGRAAHAAPAEVKRLVQKDHDTWQELANDARFQQLVEPSAAAQPGR